MGPLQRFIDSINRSPSRNVIWAFLAIIVIGGLYMALPGFIANPEILEGKALLLIVLWLSATFHEYSHALVAFSLGDNAAQKMGRLTLNPLKHIDPLGVIAMLTIGIGWAKPVPIMPMNFKNPYRDFMWTALAGPASNLLLLVISWSCFKSLMIMNPDIFGMMNEGLGKMGGGSGATVTQAQIYIYKIGWTILQINVLLAVFNMLPVPPLDGSRVLLAILPEHLKGAFHQMERYGYLALLAIMFFAPQVFWIPERFALHHAILAMQFAL